MKKIIPIIITLVCNFSNAQERTGPYFGLKKPGLVPEVFAPGFISTNKFEFGGIFSPDGNEYFFTRRDDYHGLNNRIYYTQMINNKWTMPKLSPFSMNVFEFEPTITPNGEVIYFYSERKQKRDNRFNGDIWVTTKTKNGWSEPKFYLSPINKKYCMSVAPSMHGTLFFSSNYNGNRGIFKANSNTKNLTGIQYLPDEINYLNPAHPFIAPDESYIIVDAQPSGRGKSELFISFKKEDGSWTKAINMGPQINATKSEFGASVSPDGKYLFFHRRVNGNGDIYWMDACIIQQLKKTIN